MDDSDSPPASPIGSPRSESPMFVDQNEHSSSPDSRSPDGSSRSPPVENPVHEQRYSQSASISISSRSPGHSHHEGSPEVVKPSDQHNDDPRGDTPRDDTSDAASSNDPGDNSSGVDNDDDTDPESESSDDDDDDQPGSRPDCDGCIALTGRLQKLRRRVARRDAEIAQLRRTFTARIRRLKRELARLRRINIEYAQREAENAAHRRRTAPVVPGSRRGHPTWVRILRVAIQKRTLDDTWARIYKTSASEDNYSMHYTHPYIRLVAPDNVEAGDSVGKWVSIPYAAPACPTFEGFDILPDEILLMILTELLMFPDSLVHVLSRLDKFVPLTEVPAPGTNRLHHLLYISGNVSAISLTYSCISPAVLLAPLAVNRKWNFLGVSVFYSMNTFALSSFGELNRFCTGIRAGRVARLVNIEIFFMGGKMLRFDEDKSRNRLIDRRSMPACWLGEMNRLETLVIFIDESSKSVIRRPWEPKDQKSYVRKMTEGQPNARMTRALRASRNWDAFHQLRGLDYIKLYDWAKFAVCFDRKQSLVRDESAVLDLLRTGTMEKTPQRARASQLHRLAALFPRYDSKWKPTNKTYDILTRNIYNRKLHLRPNDLDRDHSPAPKESGSRDDDDDDDDESDGAGDSDDPDDPNSSSSTAGSDSDGPDGPEGPILPTPSTTTSHPRNRGPNPAPGFDEGIFDPSDDETEEEERADDEDEEAVRRDRTTQYVQDLQTSLSDHGDEFPRPRRARSAISQLTHISDDLNIRNLCPGRQSIDLTAADGDDDDCQIIDKPRAFFSKSQSVAGLGRRSSSLFVTPGPAEYIPATVTPNLSLSPEAVASVIIDLTGGDGDDDDDESSMRQTIKRTRSVSTESEQKKRIKST